MYLRHFQIKNNYTFINFLTKLYSTFIFLHLLAIFSFMASLQDVTYFFFYFCTENKIIIQFFL